MHRHDGGAAVGLAHEMMGAFDADHLETRALQRGKHLSAAQSGEPGHDQTATRWMPTNRFADGAECCTSRHSSMASRILSINLSKERACVWQPGSSGTLATYSPSSSLSTITLNSRFCSFRMTMICPIHAAHASMAMKKTPPRKTAGGRRNKTGSV